MNLASHLYKFLILRNLIVFIITIIIIDYYSPTLNIQSNV